SDPNGNARICYLDQREVSLPADDDHLREYVDNALNPGNERGVSRVVLQSNCELLRSGMVLVDLPGIGSLNQRNAETTKQFLLESVGVIFMLRTTPPIILQICEAFADMPAGRADMLRRAVVKEK